MVELVRKFVWFQMFQTFGLRHKSDALNYTYDLWQTMAEPRPFQSNHKEINFKHFGEYWRDWKKKTIAPEDKISL